MLADLIRAAVQLVMRDKIVAGLVIVGILGIFVLGGNQKDKVNGHRFMGQSGQQVGDREAEGGGDERGNAEGGSGANQAQNQSQGQGQAQGQGQGANLNSSPQNQALTAQMRNSLAGGNAQAGGQNNPMAGNSQGATTNPAGLQPGLAVDFVRWWLTMALDYSAQTSAGNHKKAMDYAKPQVATMFKQNFYTAEVMQGVAAGTLAGSFQPVTVQAIAVNPDGSVVVTVVGNLTLQSSGSQPVSQSLQMEFLVTKDNTGVRMAGFFNKTITQAPAAAAGAGATEEVEEQPTRRRPLVGGY